MEVTYGLVEKGRGLRNQTFRCIVLDLDDLIEGEALTLSSR
jgi:hypothetical protein